MKNKNLLYIVPILLLAACKPNIDEFTPSKGNADFTSYVAVGDSWTAGMADASLYKSSQENSYPNILAGRFSLVGGGTFNQPLMVDDFGFGLGTGVPKPKLIMGFHEDCKGVTGLSPAYAPVEVNPANFEHVPAAIMNNISTPGLKTFYMNVAGMATLNPYYGRFASGAMNKVNDEISLVGATFFTLWLGSYDALAYGIGGGNDPQNQLTDIQTFAGSLQLTLSIASANNAKGAVANIPDITDAPFFHTIPYNALALDQASADMLNMAYAQLNQIIKGANSTDTLHFTAGQNALVIAEPAYPWGMRQIKSNELVLMSLPQDSLKCGGWGSQKPIPVQYVLDTQEIDKTQSMIQDYNEAISGMITENMTLVDMYSVMKTLYNDGMVFDNVKVDCKFVTGNFFSTDGLNPTPIGSAVLAYHFIEAINAKFGAAIPQVIISDYQGVLLP